MKDFGVSSVGVKYKSRIKGLCVFFCFVLTNQTLLAELSLTVRIKICDYDSVLVNVSLGALLSGPVEQPWDPLMPLFLRGESASESAEEPPAYRLMYEHCCLRCRLNGWCLSFSPNAGLTSVYHPDHFYLKDNNNNT